MFFSSQFYKTLALLTVLTALLAPQAFAADGGTSPSTDNEKPTGGASVGGSTEARRAPVLTIYKLSDTALADGSAMNLQYRFNAPAKRVRVRAIVRTGRGTYIKTLELGVRSTNVTQKTSLTANELGVRRAGSFKLRLTAKDEKKRAAKRAKKIPAWRNFTFTNRRFPLTGPFSFGSDEARFGAGRSGRSHQGQDVTADPGTRIVAPYGGVVSYATFQADAAGYYVVLRGDDGRDYVFMHMLEGSTAVKAGQRVTTGQTIGKVGSSGRSSGPHLHFEIWIDGPWQLGGKPIDPLPLLKSWLASGPGGAIRTSIAGSTAHATEGPLD